MAFICNNTFLFSAGDLNLKIITYRSENEHTDEHTLSGEVSNLIKIDASEVFYSRTCPLNQMEQNVVLIIWMRVKSFQLAGYLWLWLSGAMSCFKAMSDSGITQGIHLSQGVQPN